LVYFTIFSIILFCFFLIIKGIYGKLEKKTLHKCYISNLLNLLSKYNSTQEIGYLIEIQKVLFDDNPKISMPFLTHTIDDLRNLCTKMVSSLKIFENILSTKKITLS
jgi:hypothetical protein